VSEVDGEAAANSIYMVSDGTGSTLEQSVNAVLGQFEHCLVDRRCATSTHLFSGVNVHPLYYLNYSQFTLDFKRSP
jgi:hypothetical protein